MKKISILFLTILTVLTLLLSACSPSTLAQAPASNNAAAVSTAAPAAAAAVDPATAPQATAPAAAADNPASPAAAGTLSGMQLLAGIYKLEGTAQAVSAEQANSMLPLWQKYQAISQSQAPGRGNPPGQSQNGNTQATPQADNANANSATQTQLNDLLKQIQTVLTPAQVQAITDMKITQESIQALMKQLGVNMGAPQQGKATANGQATLPAAPDGNAQAPQGNPPAGWQQAGGANGQPGRGGMMPPDFINAFIQLLAKRAGVTVPTASAPTPRQ